MLIYTRERRLGATAKHEKLPETLWRTYSESQRRG